MNKEAKNGSAVPLKSGARARARDKFNLSVWHSTSALITVPPFVLCSHAFVDTVTGLTMII